MQRIVIADDFPGVELNYQSLEIVEKFDSIGAKGGTFDSGIIRIGSE